MAQGEQVYLSLHAACQMNGEFGEAALLVRVAEGVIEQIQGYSGTFLEELAPRFPSQEITVLRGECRFREHHTWGEKGPSLKPVACLLAKEGRQSLGGARGYQ